MAREWAGLEVREIAPLVGLDRQTVSRWEHDKGYPRDIYLERWAAVTGTDYVWLRTGIWQQPTDNPSGPETGGSASTICYADRFRVLRAA